MSASGTSPPSPPLAAVASNTSLLASSPSSSSSDTIEEKKEDAATTAGDRRRRRRPLSAVHHTSSSSGPNSSFEEERPRHCINTTPPHTPPRSPPRYQSALRPSPTLAAARRRRQREGGVIVGNISGSNNNSNNEKHVVISPQYYLRDNESPGGCSFSNKSVEDAETKTTTTAATSAVTTSSSAIGNSTGHRRDDQQQHQQQPHHEQTYTALSDMVHCAHLTPAPPEDTRGGGTSSAVAANNSSSCDVALPIPLTLPQNELLSHHDDDDDDGYKYYRIAYRGVVALLSAPEQTAPRSGSYLSYGEVFCSAKKHKKAASSENKRTLEQLLEPKFSPRRHQSSTLKANGNLRGLVGGVAGSPTSLAGDISASSSDVEANDNLRPSCRIEHLAATGPPIPSLPSRSGSSSSSSSDNHRKHHHRRGVVRVDHVLTGGYAMDTTHADDTTTCTTGGMHQNTPSSAKTPKRSNGNSLGYYLPVPDYDDSNHTKSKASSNNQDGALGFLFLHRHNTQIVEPLQTRPQTESGLFLYKVVSNTPLPILTGPAIDAPKTKAMLLPGTVHEVSVRVCIEPRNAEDAVWFLRLSHRRGWIADRKVCKRKLDNNTSNATTSTTVPVVQEVFVEANNDSSTADEASIVSSIAVSSVSAPSTAARRRHRPPRRRRDGGRVVEDDNKPLPRQIGGQQQQQQQQRSLTLTPVKMNKHNDSSMDGKVPSPSSNLSLLSDDEESYEHHNNSKVSRQHHHHPSSPDCSFAASIAQSAASTQLPALMLPKAAPAKKSTYYLMRVTAPRGLKILDAPQFQVNRLIHGGNVSSSHLVSQVEPQNKPHHSIFQTMSGRLTTTTGSTNHAAIMDANTKTRILPRGVLFEASSRIETTSGYSHGLIKLSDQSGWAIVPTQEDLDQQYHLMAGAGMTDVKEGEAMRAFEEVGNAVIGDDADTSVNNSRGVATVTADDSVWLRVVARSGVPVSCPPPSPPLASENDNDHSPSSKGSSAISSSTNHGSNFGPLTSHDSDVASSVGSAFLDAMFRTPKKNRQKDSGPPPARPAPESHHQPNNVIPCGMVVQVERPAADDNNNDEPQHHEFARLCGGQGWVPLTLSGKQVSMQVQPPEIRVGSFWFRVQSSRGIKVRLGPSRRAPSIKSDDGIYFRFECGEFLRTSEIITVFNENGEPEECYAKLYRNRHVRLRDANIDYRSLCSLTNQAEFVQVYSSKELYLEECAMEPRIERHKQGWRYSIVPDSGVSVRRGPSFAAEKVDIHLNADETVVVNERVSPAGEKITWLRLKNGKGWVHDRGDHGEQIMVTHSFRQRSSSVLDRPQKGPAPKEKIAYNTIIARLFHNDTG